MIRANRIGCIIITCLLCMMAAAYSANAAPISFSGSLTGNLALRQYVSPGVYDTTKYTGQSELKFTLKDYLTPYAKVEGSFNLILLVGDSADVYNYSLSLEDSQEHGMLVGDTRLLPLFQTRKLYLSLFSDRFTFTLGRQIINYGVGYVFSPIDCFSTVDLQDTGFSRKGSDIIRVQIPTGDLAGIEGVTTLSFDDNVSAVKVFGNLLDYDWSLTGIYKKQMNELLTGLTFKGDLIAGIHGELVGHHNYNTGVDYFEGMAGADYSFADGRLLLLGEYYYYSNPLETKPPDRTFPGRQYLFCQTNYTLDEIRRLNLNGIYNLSEGSWVGNFQFFYNIFQNTNLLLYARYYKGDLNGLNSLKDSAISSYGIQAEVKF